MKRLDIDRNVHTTTDFEPALRRLKGLVFVVISQCINFNILIHFISFRLQRRGKASYLSDILESDLSISNITIAVWKTTLRPSSPVNGLSSLWLSCS